MPGAYSVINGEAWFVSGGGAIYKTDGTPEGTIAASTLFPELSSFISVGFLTRMGNTLFFAGYYPVGTLQTLKGVELWGIRFDAAMEPTDAWIVN